MDLMGKNIYTSSSLWIANQQTLLSQYNFVNWVAMSKFAGQLPEATSEECQSFVTRGCLVAKTLLQSMLDIADTFGQSDGLGDNHEKAFLAAEFRHCSPCAAGHREFALP